MISSLRDAIPVRNRDKGVESGYRMFSSPFRVAIIPKACNSSEFTCANKRCVAKEYQCDLADNCGDNSDESSSACSKENPHI